MSFGSYKTIGAAIKEFQIAYTEANFVQELDFTLSDYFREDLTLMMREGVVDNSEFAICENLIYPVLKEIWKHYRSKFLLWSHQSLNYDENLSGFPEYILARRSPLGKVVFDRPYLMLVEAKQDNFEAAWGQCIAEMIAAQRLNAELDVVIFGITSNGDRWQIGKLEQKIFTKNSTFYTIQELDKLAGALNFVFIQCEAQLERVGDRLVA
ncbi:hypothetical protein [Pseudanabaena sp. PCC 6802]|uniref:hypothetical protein n=1 Tax=Pseudanabaena sp. PCC 6802 TaxID=118173 RepID=UPI000348AF06|nr:hypothetical protein [Pseudanabaena sp. PCC 6802]